MGHFVVEYISIVRIVFLPVQNFSDSPRIDIEVIPPSTPAI